MHKKIEESAKNVSQLKDLCTTDCTQNEKDDLKTFYMNKYGGYMTANIISTFIIEFILMYIIMVMHMDSAWEHIPYADTIIYGTLWGSGGIYLLQMMIRVVLNSYDLKLALDADRIKKSTVDISFDKFEDGGKKTKLCIYTKQHGKNKASWFFINKSKHKGMRVFNNIDTYEHAGTKLMAYNIDDKKNDLFIMVKDKPISETADKVMKKMLDEALWMQKVKFNVFKSKFKKTGKGKSKK